MLLDRIVRILLPRQGQFFDLLEGIATQIEAAARVFAELQSAVGHAQMEEIAARLKMIEKEADGIERELHRELDRTFVTPIDREDIYELASALDDIVDYTEEVADYLGLYKIEAPMVQAQRLAAILVQSCRQIAEAVPRMRTFKAISDHTIEIHRLENDGDRVTREAMASLFNDGIDPMVVIRWKDIYERLEAAIDSTERAANILESIVIKNR